MKRFWALLAALLMLISAASAQEISSTPIAAYALPSGAQAVHLWESGVWEVPEGLEEMYRVMQNATMYGDVYLVRMGNGRALVSVSCMQPKTLRTAEELHAMWPQIAMNIAKEGVTVNADESCAKVETLYGYEALHIQTTIGLGEMGAGMQLDAEGIAFARGNELLEVWAVIPAEGSYPADETAARELEEDRADLTSFMQSLNFNDLASMSVEGVAYVDPDGRFGLVIPKDSTVLTVHSTQQEIAAAREAYLAAHPEGAERFFDEYISDVTTQHVTVVITQDQQGVAEIFASQEENFRGATVEQLASLAQPIGQSLAGKFDVAMLLSNSETTVISGKEHAWLGYWLRSGEADVQLDVMASVLDDAWLYEVDIFTHEGDQNMRALLLTLVSQTMQYNPLTNALE